MLLSGALLTLFVTGCWLYCLTDAILTPAPDCRGLSKQAWIAIIAVTFIVGALAWLIAGRPVRDQASADEPGPGRGYDGPAGGRAGRPSAGQARVWPAGPDDDPDFLHALGVAIRRNPPVS
jgi:Phospholipase_D-nuclease N-terminal